MSDIRIPEMTKELAERTAQLANHRLRETFLADGTAYVQRMEKLGGSSLRRMRKDWNPIEPRVLTGNKIVMHIRTSDVMRMTFAEKQQIQPIVMECAMRAIKENKRSFLTGILQDAISKDPNLKYG